MSKVLNWLVLLFVVVLLLAGGWFLYAAPKCDMPIKFTLSSIDPRFNLQQSDIKTVAVDAAERWNKAIGRALFEYDASSGVKVNFVYDDRQQQLDDFRAAVKKINGQDSSLAGLNSSLDTMIAKYQSDLAGYNSALADYNNQIESWNSRGGAPAGVVSQLQTQKSVLDAQRSKLEIRRQDIIKYSQLYNSQVSQYNNDLTNLRQSVAANQNRLITQGLYYSAEHKIDIFTFGDIDELKLVLMHEIGHATGIEHTSDNNSVMSAILNKNMVNNPLPTSHDINLVSNQCNLTPSFHSIQYYEDYLSSLINYRLIKSIQ